MMMISLVVFLVAPTIRSWGSVHENYGTGEERGKMRGRQVSDPGNDLGKNVLVPDLMPITVRVSRPHGVGNVVSRAKPKSLGKRGKRRSEPRPQLQIEAGT